MPQLPSAVVTASVNVQKKSSSIMMLVAVYAKEGRYQRELHRPLRQRVRPRRTQRVNGAGQAQIMGVRTRRCGSDES